MRLSLITLLVVVAGCSSVGPVQPVPPAANNAIAPNAPPQDLPPCGHCDGSIESLLKAPRLVEYVNDGAADSSVLEENFDPRFPLMPPPEVRAIVQRGADILPELIAHLDDPRPTAAGFVDGPYTRQAPLAVPLGHVCLDILTHVVADSPVLFYDPCGDDGLGACIQPGYYFRPDAMAPAGPLEPGTSVRTVKANWERAFRRGDVRYSYVIAWK